MVIQVSKARLPDRSAKQRPHRLATLALATSLIATGSGVFAPPLFATTLASGQKQPAKPPSQAGHKGTQALTPSEAARKAQHANGGGRVLSVRRNADGYQVKLIKEGEVRIVFIPID